MKSKAGHDPFAKSSLRDVQRAAAETLMQLNAFPHLVEAFIDRSGLPQTRVGGDPLGQADFVRLMRKGRHFKLDTLRAVLAFIAAWEKN